MISAINGLAALLMLIVTGALAQTGGTSLPKSLSGRWTFMGPSGVLIDTFTIVFDGDGAPGMVPGRLTWRGRSCGAKDEPLKASWDGNELKFEAVLKANVNTQRMNGDCPGEPTRWALKRKAGEASFEGEGRMRDLMVTVTAAP
jgi:hypothetical protein